MSAATPVACPAISALTSLRVRALAAHGTVLGDAGSDHLTLLTFGCGQSGRLMAWVGV